MSLRSSRRRDQRRKFHIKIEDDSGDEEAVEAGQRRYDASILKCTLKTTKTITTKSGLQITTGFLANKKN